MAKTTTITVRGVLSGKTITLEEDLKMPEGLPGGGEKLHLPNDVPVTMHLEISMPPGMLSAYGAWRDVPGIQNFERDLYELRYGKRCGEDRWCVREVGPEA